MSKAFLPRLCKGLVALASLLLPLNLVAVTPPGLLDNDHAAVRAVLAVQEQVTADWMRQPEVLGTAIGLDAAGAPALVVYVNRDARTQEKSVVRSRRNCAEPE